MGFEGCQHAGRHEAHAAVLVAEAAGVGRADHAQRRGDLRGFLCAQVTGVATAQFNGALYI